MSLSSTKFLSLATAFGAFSVSTPKALSADAAPSTIQATHAGGASSEATAPSRARELLTHRYRGAQTALAAGMLGCKEIRHEHFLNSITSREKGFGKNMSLARKEITEAAESENVAGWIFGMRPEIGRNEQNVVRDQAFSDLAIRCKSLKGSKILVKTNRKIDEAFLPEESALSTDLNELLAAAEDKAPGTHSLILEVQPKCTERPKEEQKFLRAHAECLFHNAYMSEKKTELEAATKLKNETDPPQNETATGPKKPSLKGVLKSFSAITTPSEINNHTRNIDAEMARMTDLKLLPCPLDKELAQRFADEFSKNPGLAKLELPSEDEVVCSIR